MHTKQHRGSFRNHKIILFLAESNLRNNNLTASTTKLMKYIGTLKGRIGD